MTTIVINTRHGGFALSREAMALARYLSDDPQWGGPCVEGDTYSDGTPVNAWADSYAPDIERDDPMLVQVVRELGTAANGDFATLKAVEIPDGVDWELSDYGGWETIHEKHRQWTGDDDDGLPDSE